jgi:hypothetical protein
MVITNNSMVKSVNKTNAKPKTKAKVVEEYKEYVYLEGGSLFADEIHMGEIQLTSSGIEFEASESPREMDMTESSDYWCTLNNQNDYYHIDTNLLATCTIYDQSGEQNDTNSKMEDAVDEYVANNPLFPICIQEVSHHIMDNHTVETVYQVQVDDDNVDYMQFQCPIVKDITEISCVELQNIIIDIVADNMAYISGRTEYDAHPNLFQSPGVWCNMMSKGNE